MHQTEPRKTTAAALLGTALTLALAVGPGCGGGSSWSIAGGEPAPSVRPDDFVGEPDAPRDMVEVQTAPELTATDVGEDAPPADNRAATTPRTEALAVDAMVGHINGEAVYASQIFEPNIEAQLAAFGRQYDGEQFRLRATTAIGDRLRTVIMNKLILGEAERNLGENDRARVDFILQAHREELLRKFGQGSIAVAKASFYEEAGVPLDEHLAQYREGLTMKLYQDKQVMPKVVVNRRDVSDWYKTHIDDYMQPDRRVLRMIRTTDAEAAAQAQRRLARGEAFEAVAADAAVNQYNTPNAGQFNGGEPLVGNEIMGIQALNDAILALDQGGHTETITAGQTHYIVQVVKLERGETITLEDAQIRIRELLEGLQKDQLAQQLRMEMWQRGSFSDPNEMGAKLLEIAIARFDQ